MQRIEVIITFPDGHKLPCGEIFVSDPDSRGKMEGRFKYFQDYLTCATSFSLDPENLPLTGEEFDPDRKEGVHGVFEDALPDSWGRRLLAQKWRLSKPDQTVFNLLKLQGGIRIRGTIFPGRQND